MPTFKCFLSIIRNRYYACKNMVKWTPATFNKQAVDCFFRLGFTNQVGKIKVDYRED